MDGTALLIRLSEQNRHNRRHLLPKCYQFLQLLSAVGNWAERAGSAQNFFVQSGFSPAFEQACV